ncbi:hypothetical protein LENED_009288 [Lentinula edodes]|uniref:Uncharacterized protein n=1 Tax=Lentinula edodes TaxID=5353 RepID=A0A1Q3EJA6_LENED|nr:hypothetical protein LENED_009288 [Lentinula edodes]
MTVLWSTSGSPSSSMVAIASQQPRPNTQAYNNNTTNNPRMILHPIPRLFFPAHCVVDRSWGGSCSGERGKDIFFQRIEVYVEKKRKRPGRFTLRANCHASA